MAVRVEDQDIDADDLVDVVIFNQAITPGSGWTSYQNIGGYYGRAEIDARFRIYCNTNYYGSACNIYCVPTDNSQGHYTCGSNGNKVCRSGWTDASNNCLTREFSAIELHNGMLVLFPFMSSCVYQWLQQCWWILQLT